MNDQEPIGKAMVQGPGNETVDECAVFAKSRTAAGILFRFERELNVGEGQRMMLDIWQHSGEVAAPEPAPRPAAKAAKKENGDVQA
jgi:hypothetical protein